MLDKHTDCKDFYSPGLSLHDTRARAAVLQEMIPRRLDMGLYAADETSMSIQWKSAATRPHRPKAQMISPCSRSQYPYAVEFRETAYLSSAYAHFMQPERLHGEANKPRNKSVGVPARDWGLSSFGPSNEKSFRHFVRGPAKAVLAN